MTPAVRARVTWGLLEAGCDGLPPVLLEKLRAKVPPEALRLRERGNAFAWVPLATHMGVLEAIRAVVGDGDYRRRIGRGSLLTMQDGLFRGLLDVALSALSVTPNGVLRWAPRGYALSFQLCGNLVHREIEASRARVSLIGFPVEASATGTFALGFAGTLDTLIEVARHTGRATVLSDPASPGRMDFDLRWEARKLVDARRVAQ